MSSSLGRASLGVPWQRGLVSSFIDRCRRRQKRLSRLLSSSSPLLFFLASPSSAAHGAAARGQPLSIAVIEPRSPAPLTVAANAANPDIRVFALTHASQRTLAACGSVGADIMATGRVTSFDTMQVWDALGKGHITFDAQDLVVSEGSDENSPASLFSPTREDDRRAAEIIDKTKRVVEEMSSRAALAASSAMAAAGVIAGKDFAHLLPFPLRDGDRPSSATAAAREPLPTFDHTPAKPLGFIAENDVLNGALFDELQRLHSQGQIDLVCPAKVTKMALPPMGRALQVLPEARGEGVPPSSSTGSASDGFNNSPNPDSLASISLDNGKTIKARLVVGADGVMSAVRTAASIGTWGWSYDQTAVVATVKTNRSHGTAWQRFLPHGPVAVLPLWGDLSSIVWSTSPDHAMQLVKMSPQAFTKALNTVLHASSSAFTAALTGASEAHLSEASSQEAAADTEEAAYKNSLYNKERDTFYLDPLWWLQKAGKSLVEGLATLQAQAGVAPPWQPPPLITEVVGAKASFPLRFQSASAYVAPRVALIGDAAHSVHPLAGQGLNLGIADAECLATVLLEALESGADVGSLNTLNEYGRRQAPSNLVKMAGFDTLKRLFDWQLDTSQDRKSVV